MRLLLSLALMLLLIASPALACAPCPKTLDLAASVNAADAIVIGKRTDQANAEHPEFINIEVEAVLKGKLEPGVTIRTKSWVGQCPFGIVTNTGEAAVFILSTSKDGDYTALQNGCAVKKIPYENGFVTIDNNLAGINAPGSEILSLKAFVKRYLPDIIKKSE
jgi:hypothetical protein